LSVVNRSQSLPVIKISEFSAMNGAEKVALAKDCKKVERYCTRSNSTNIKEPSRYLNDDPVSG
jgi:hypothetical protein